jgi:hypothetical protein
MPAKAGIHGFLCCNEGKSCMPAFAGMTRWARPARYLTQLFRTESCA